MTKKTMKMQRVSEDSGNTPVKTPSGAVLVMGGEKDEQEVAAPVSKPVVAGNLSKGTSGMIAMNAPADDEMEEVSFEELQKSQKSDLTGPQAEKTATQIINDLIGKGANAAKEVLEGFLSSKKITSYRIVPIGQPMTMDISPGRVQVLIDAQKRVIDIQIS